MMELCGVKFSYDLLKNGSGWFVNLGLDRTFYRETMSNHRFENYVKMISYYDYYEFDNENQGSILDGTSIRFKRNLIKIIWEKDYDRAIIHNVVNIKPTYSHFSDNENVYCLDYFWCWFEEKIRPVIISPICNVRGYLCGWKGINKGDDYLESVDSAVRYNTWKPVKIGKELVKIFNTFRPRANTYKELKKIRDGCSLEMAGVIDEAIKKARSSFGEFFKNVFMWDISQRSFMIFYHFKYAIILGDRDNTIFYTHNTSKIIVHLNEMERTRNTLLKQMEEYRCMKKRHLLKIIQENNYKIRPSYSVKGLIMIILKEEREFENDEGEVLIGKTRSLEDYYYGIKPICIKDNCEKICSKKGRWNLHFGCRQDCCRYRWYENRCFKCYTQDQILQIENGDYEGSNE